MSERGATLSCGHHVSCLNEAAGECEWCAALSALQDAEARAAKLDAEVRKLEGYIAEDGRQRQRQGLATRIRALNLAEVELAPGGVREAAARLAEGVGP